MSRCGLILGDQLSGDLATLRVLDPASDVIIMAEVADEAGYVKHHVQKIALFFSAMRHFAGELRNAGWRVIYHQYDAASPLRSLLSVVQHTLSHSPCDSLIVTQCGEYRLQSDIDQHWQQTLGIPVTVYEDDRFLCSLAEFRNWATDRRQLRMEYFYRRMRRHTGLLMEDDQPCGGRWNFDSDNRAAYRGEVPLPPPLTFSRDDTDRTVLQLVEQQMTDHPGQLQPFRWPTTRAQALQALEHFIQHSLPHFGRYQDAMLSSQPSLTDDSSWQTDVLFHSLLSPAINLGLLSPREVCHAAQQAWYRGHAPLNAVEGFIRQIIGWREYVRGIYWLMMPDYAAADRQNNQRDLPACYWNAETDMRCMQECLRATFSNAWAHHIQRLMVTGNFALLAGVRPAAICDWYLAVYADAIDWVELPNTLGMVMHADGGLLGSKPYAASGKYIDRQSDYCRSCRYQVKTAEQPDSCPFNSLYWHFLHRHRAQFAGNPRMTMMYRSFDRMSADKQQAILARAEYCLQHLDTL
ncbi:MAG: cryptochrome/photolyase family protein [Pseudomonadota bacterium]|nr:cryptochrome/photolyase family protein [Pseudomonadota bacterium]